MKLIRVLCTSLLTTLLATQLAIAAPVNFTGGETGGGNEFQSFSGLSSVVTTPVKTGVYAYELRATTGGNSAANFRCLSASGAVATCNIANLFLGMWISPATLPSVSQVSVPLITGQNVSFVNNFSLNITNGGLLVLNNQAGTPLLTGASVLSVGTYAFVQLKVVAGTSGAYQLLVNNVSQGTGTGDFTTGNTGQLIFGPNVNLTNGTADFFYDDIVIDDTAFTGAVFQKLQPCANTGSTHQWVSGVPTPDPISSINNIPANNATYWKSASAGDVGLCALQSTTLSGISGTIIATKTWNQRREDISVTSSDKIRTRESATNTDSSAINLTTSDTDSFQLLTTKPSGGAWTTTALDGTEIGPVEANAVAVRLNDMAMLVLSDQITPTPTPTPTATPTNTPIPPTATPTNTPIPPTATPTPVPAGGAGSMFSMGIGQ